MSWAQVAAGVELPFAPDHVVPELHPFPLDVPTSPAVTDIEGAARAPGLRTFAGSVTPGMTVAVDAGSRQLHGRVEQLGVTIGGLRELGAEQFVRAGDGFARRRRRPGQLARARFAVSCTQYR